jgi:tetratricopeptide (TPR) repeat protein
MATWELRTIGPVALVGTDRAVSLDDPMLIAFLAVLAMAGDHGIASNDLQLLLTPDAKRDVARRKIARLDARTRELLGADALEVRSGERFALAAGALSLDVDVRPAEGESEYADFLRDLRLSDAPEFDAWLAAARRRVRPKIVAAREGTAIRQGNTLRLAAAGIVVALAIGGYVMSRPSTGFATGDVVLLADVANRTGDTLLDQGILAAASVALQQSGRVRLYSRGRLPAVYRLMKIDDRGTPPPPLDYELAQDVAERVRWVLGLTVARSIDGYHVGARVTDVRRHLEIADVATSAATRGDVIGALDDVLLRVRRKLGESRWDVRGRHEPLPLVTTASLEALRSYAEGASAWSTMRFNQAAELWLRAVDLDTGFAMAYGALGGWHYYHHDRAKGEFYYQEAFKRSERLTEWERLRLLQNQATYRGNLDSALVLSRTTAERFPSVGSWYGYGTSLMQSGRFEEAMAAFRRGLTFDSLHVNSLINLATSAKGLKRWDDAIHFYERAGQLDSNVLYTGNINGEYGGALVHAGRPADAEAAFRHVVARDAIADRMLGLRSLGWLALWQGRLSQGIGDFQQAIDASQQMNNPLGEGRNRMLLAGAYRTANRTADANAEMSRVLVLAKSPLFEPSMLAVVMFSCQQLDRARDVESVAALLHERVKPDNHADRVAEAYAGGIVQLLRHHPDSALVYFRQAADFPVRAERLMNIAEAFQALGIRDSVRVALIALADADEFGSQGQDEWLRAPLLLGDALLAMGDSAGAIKRYQEITTRWRDATSDTPDLATARARLAGLVGKTR